MTETTNFKEMIGKINDSLKQHKIQTKNNDRLQKKFLLYAKIVSKTLNDDFYIFKDQLALPLRFLSKLATTPELFKRLEVDSFIFSLGSIPTFRDLLETESQLGGGQNKETEWGQWDDWQNQWNKYSKKPWEKQNEKGSPRKSMETRMKNHALAETELEKRHPFLKRLTFVYEEPETNAQKESMRAARKRANQKIIESPLFNPGRQQDDPQKEVFEEFQTQNINSMGFDESFVDRYQREEKRQRKISIEEPKKDPQGNRKNWLVSPNSSGKKPPLPRATLKIPQLNFKSLMSETPKQKEKKENQGNVSALSFSGPPTSKNAKETPGKGLEKSFRSHVEPPEENEFDLTRFPERNLKILAEFVRLFILEGQHFIDSGRSSLCFEDQSFEEEKCEKIPPLKRMNEDHKKHVMLLYENYQSNLEVTEGRTWDPTKLAPFDKSKIKDQGPDMKSLKLPASQEMPEFGSITKASVIQKAIGKSSKYHDRFLILRGFSLYWYKDTKDMTAKGVLSLPLVRINSLRLNNMDFFEIAETKSSRGMVFLENSNGTEWRIILQNQIAYKFYMKYSIENKQKMCQDLVDYFLDFEIQDLKMKGHGYTYPQLFFELLADSFEIHSKLKMMHIENVSIDQSSFRDIRNSLKHKGVSLIKLKLENVNLSLEALEEVCAYLETEVGLNVKVLSLRNNNGIGDAGGQKIGETLYARYRKYASISSFTTAQNIIPIRKLDLSGTKLGDQGLLSVVVSLDKVRIDNQKKLNVDYNEFYSLNFSNNEFSKNSLNSLGKFISQCNGVRKLNVSNNKFLIGDAFTFLLRMIKRNTSMTKLYYEENELGDEGIDMLYEILQFNFTLTHIKLTFPRNKLSHLCSQEAKYGKYFHIA